MKISNKTTNLVALHCSRVLANPCGTPERIRWSQCPHHTRPYYTRLTRLPDPSIVGAGLALPNRRQAKQPQPHPRATARVPTPLHATPALTKTPKRALAVPFLCKGGCGEDEGMGPLRSPWGGALPTHTTRSLDAYWTQCIAPLKFESRSTLKDVEPLVAGY